MTTKPDLIRKWLVVTGIISAGAAMLWMALEWTSHQRSPEISTPSSQAVDVEAIRAKAELGDVQAQAQLGRLCESQQSAADRYVQAAKWFERAAARGNADAQAGLAELYEAGQGVRKDLTKAIELYRLAAEQGHPGAEYALGFDYELGRGVAQDQVQAAKWFRLAADQGLALAQYDLGQRCDLGVGVPQDRIEALKWLMLAADQGQPDAAARRDTLKKTMTRKEISQATRLVEGFPRSRPGDR